MPSKSTSKQEDIFAELSIWAIQHVVLQDNVEEIRKNEININPNYFNYHIRRLLPPRGNRFRHDHQNTCMYIERSKNANVVAYTANLINKETQQRTEEKSGTSQCECVFDERNPIHAYFLKIDPAYIHERRAQGIIHDDEELNILERKFAYGCNVEPLRSELTLRKILHKSDAFVRFVRSLQKHSIIEEQQEQEQTTTTTFFTKSVNECKKSVFDKVKVDNVEIVIDKAIKWWTHWQPHVMTFVALPHHSTLLLRLPPPSLPTLHVTDINDKINNIEQSDDMSKSNSEAFSCNYNNESKENKLEYENRQQSNNNVNDAHDCNSLTDTIVVLITFIDGKLSVLHHVFVKSVEPKHFYQLPSVEYVELHGTSLSNAQSTYEKIVKESKLKRR